MTYDPRPNASGDTLVESRNPIRINFEVIRDAFAVNHFGFNETNEGKHEFLQMPELQQVDIPNTAVNEVGFYAKVGTNPAESNLFFRAESNGFEYQLTKAVSGVNSEARFGTNTNYQVGPPSLNGGWTFLPGNMILQYGVTNVASSSDVVITFPIPFPNAIFSYSLTKFKSSTNTFTKQGIWVRTASTTAMTARSNDTHSWIYSWQAWGN